jgi:hypothetical protein
MNDHSGPLLGQFEKYFYEKNKLKTTSVVSYAVKPIVKLQRGDSFFRVWKHANKDALLEEKDHELLDEYVEFCGKQLSLFLAAVKSCVDGNLWTANKAIKGRFLTTTNINGMIICMRKTLETGRLHNFEFYRQKFNAAQITKFPFSEYKSSQYTRMGQDLYDKVFG